MKTLVFDVFGDFGHFRKFYTTSSPLTFAFPPPPTIKGMLGAVIGCDKTEYLQVFSEENCRVAIRILKPIKKTRMGINYINTKNNHWIPTKKGRHSPRSPICIEFVKEPNYRFYVTHKEEQIFKELKSNIEEGKTVFTLSLGLSELLAGFKYRDTLDFREVLDVKKEVSTVVPMNLIVEQGTVFEEGKKYFKEKLSVDMTPDRVVQRYEDVLFEVQGKSILAELKKCWKGDNGENITFF